MAGGPEMTIGAARRAAGPRPAAPRAMSAPPPVQLAQADIDGLVALYQAGDHAMAAERGEALAAQFPDSLMLLNVFGAACLALGDHARAESAFRRALALDGSQPSLLANLGTALMLQRRLDEAVEAFRCALSLAPDYAEGHYNLGNALRKQRDIAAAVAAYRRALALKPDHVAALNNLGRALHAQGRLEDAAATYSRALGIKPDFAEALHNLGDVLLEQHNYPAAIEAYRLSLKVKPDNETARIQKLYAQAQICDFTAFAEFDATPESDAPLPPFPMLAFTDDPARQLRHSRNWANAWELPPPLPLPVPPPGERIRVGYFSADFHDHATLHLMAGLFRAHDRSRFEIACYSYGPDKPGAMRADLIAHVDRFAEVSTASDAEVVRLARADGLDIAVDLKGNTQHSRSHLFAQRLAPVQVAYLGYPGSMGADYFDYILADPVVIPASERPFYSEKVLALPGSYQANDDRRAVAESAGRRAEHGLPQDAFVFCCFNQNYKICPRAFVIWMRLLAQVPRSVLWLLESNVWTEANLRREAEAHGIDAGRLILAERLPNAAHLARLRHADLFLDTFAVNAHTTASDALWAGLPVLTRAGRQFAARVGASLLTAIGLPELIAASDEEYEALALALARDPARLAGLRTRLAANRTTQPLFDTASYARALERGFEAVHRRRLEGLAPDHVTVGWERP